MRNVWLVLCMWYFVFTGIMISLAGSGKLDLASLSFFEQFRKIYVGDQVQKTSKVSQNCIKNSPLQTIPQVIFWYSVFLLASPIYPPSPHNLFGRASTSPSWASPTMAARYQTWGVAPPSTHRWADSCWWILGRMRRSFISSWCRWQVTCVDPSLLLSSVCVLLSSFSQWAQVALAACGGPEYGIPGTFVTFQTAETQRKDSLCNFSDTWTPGGKHPRTV